MRYPEEELIDILRENGVDVTASLPCEKIRVLIEMVGGRFFHIPLTREEEGVGICAGAALSGKRPALFVQSSGIGNMVNALLSLTQFYELPLAVFVSQRGVYQEKIAAQFPMGRRLPMILKGAGIPYSSIGSRKDFEAIRKNLPEVYRKDSIHVFLLSPALWQHSGCTISAAQEVTRSSPSPAGRTSPGTAYPMRGRRPVPRFTRYEILEMIAPFLDSKVVVCNLGFPSKELYHIRHQPSNFYMLGSMGMVTPIGLGIATNSDRDVVVIDGDGSLLMNPGTLATAAFCSPRNLTILAVDNAVYGSTGNQPTFTGSLVDLEVVARGFGIKDTMKTAGKRPLIEAMKAAPKTLRFIHVIAVPGNREVPNIPIHHLEIKRQVRDFLSGRS